MPDTRRVWRWEQSVFNFCKHYPTMQHFVGILIPDNHWHTVARSREFWSSFEDEFVASLRVCPRSTQRAMEDAEGLGAVDPSDVEF